MGDAATTEVDATGASARSRRGHMSGAVAGRVVLVAAVAGAAASLRPLHAALWPNVAAGVVLGGLVVEL